MAENLRRQGASPPAHPSQCGTTQVLTTDATLLRLLVSRRWPQSWPVRQRLEVTHPEVHEYALSGEGYHAVHHHSQPHRWRSVLGASRDRRAAGQAETVVQQVPDGSIILAQTQGMNRRTDRRDTRQDCRGQEGAVGMDKRNCKQQGRATR